MSFASRFIRLSLAVSMCIGWLILASGSASAQTRHHITVGLGYSKLTSSDVKDDALGIDFSNAGNGVLAYRYTLNPNVDLTLDSRGTVSMDSSNGVDLVLLNSFFGPGVRWRPAAASRLYLQGTFFLSSESAEAEVSGVSVSASESGTGFGLFGGVDLPMSPLLSLPIEAHYIYSKPADDVSGFGATIGLTFNFGAMQ